MCIMTCGNLSLCFYLFTFFFGHACVVRAVVHVRIAQNCKRLSKGSSSGEKGICALVSSNNNDHSNFRSSKIIDAFKAILSNSMWIANECQFCDFSDIALVALRLAASN